MKAAPSVRRTLRRLPAFRQLPVRELDALAARMVRREFERGDVLWHDNAGPGRLCILESGEAVLERRYRGRVVRSRVLRAGEPFGAGVLGERNGEASLCVRALADGTLYVLTDAKPRLAGRGRSGRRRRRPSSPPMGVWAALVLLAICLLTWQDLSRILSGAFFLASTRFGPGAGEGSALFLNYAAWVDPRAAFAYNQAGYLRLQQGDLPGAQADFLYSLRVDVGNSPALNNLAVTYYNLDQGGQAAEAQRSAVSLDPDRAVLQYNLGEILLERGAEREALRAFREASLISPDWAIPHVQAGCIYLRWLDHARAEGEAREALRLDPTQGAAHLILAIALYHRGELPEAYVSVEQALQIDPAQEVARFYQALILHALGETEAALAVLEELRGSTDDPLLAARAGTEIEALRRVIHDLAPPGEP